MSRGEKRHGDFAGRGFTLKKTFLSSGCPTFSTCEGSSNKLPIQNRSVSPFHPCLAPQAPSPRDSPYLTGIRGWRFFLAFQTQMDGRGRPSPQWPTPPVERPPSGRSPHCWLQREYEGLGFAMYWGATGKAQLVRRKPHSFACSLGRAASRFAAVCLPRAWKSVPVALVSRPFRTAGRGLPALPKARQIRMVWFYAVPGAGLGGAVTRR